MSKKSVEFYDIIIKMSIMKKWWDSDNSEMSEDIIKNKVQSGIEVPIYDISVDLHE
jgi:hypothetical protein